MPADIVLACGVFGDVSDEDIRATVMMLPRLLAPGGVVLWTRHRREPEPDTIHSVVVRAGRLEEIAFDTEEDLFGVGTHRLLTPPLPSTRA